MSTVRSPKLGNLDVQMMYSFLALMEQCSVSKAAVQLNVSQPTMSHCLGQLRALFNDPLLIAAHGKMVPTTRAFTLQTEIRKIVGAIDQLIANDQVFDPSKDTSTMVVSASETFDYLLLPPLVARLQREAPGMRVQFRSSDRTKVGAWLENGELDFRLAHLQEPADKLRTRKLFEDRWLSIVCADHPLVRGSLTLAQYMALPHVCLDILGPTTGERAIDSALAEAGGERVCTARVQSSLLFPHIIASSNAIATLPARVARSFKHFPLQLLEPPISLAPMSCSLYWHERTHREPRHIWFRQLLAEVAQSDCADA